MLENEEKEASFSRLVELFGGTKKIKFSFMGALTGKVSLNEIAWKVMPRRLEFILWSQLGLFSKSYGIL